MRERETERDRGERERERGAGPNGIISIPRQYIWAPTSTKGFCQVLESLIVSPNIKDRVTPDLPDLPDSYLKNLKPS